MGNKRKQRTRRSGDVANFAGFQREQGRATATRSYFLKKQFYCVGIQ